MTRDMCIAVCELGLWDTVKNFEGKSFMYHAPNEIYRLDSHPLVDKYGHSGASFGLCIRNVQTIAKYGLDYYLEIQNSH
jgi:hypothetical protein